METKSDDERIIVNGGCFPLHWVRKFFNIATDDIQNGAVTEAKLDDALAKNIEQAVAELHVKWGVDSGAITVTHTNGESEELALAPATTTTAGIMSAEDKIKLDGITNKCIDIEDIDTIPASREEAVTMAIDTSHSRYILRYGKINVGAIDIFSDDLGHQLTEVLTTHYDMTSGDAEPSHSDVEVYTYYRSYNIDSFELARNGVPRGTWSEWQQCVGKLTNDELEKILQ